MLKLCTWGDRPISVVYNEKNQPVFRPRHKCFSNHPLCRVCRGEAKTLLEAEGLLGSQSRPMCAACDWCETDKERDKCPIRRVGIKTADELREIGFERSNDAENTGGARKTATKGEH